MKRGEIYIADLSETRGCEQGGLRPVLILQNNIGNAHSPTTIVAPITSRKKKGHLPTHVRIEHANLTQESTVLAEQIRTIDKSRVLTFIGALDEKDMQRINHAVIVSLDIE